MKQRFLRNTISLMSFVILVFFSASSCGDDKKETRITLPETGQLSFSMGWGVVLTNYIRIRATPAQDGIEITALAKGALVTILDKGKQETQKDVTAFWYQVDDGKNRGWLFGAHLTVFHERAEAEKFQADLKEKPVE